MAAIIACTLTLSRSFHASASNVTTESSCWLQVMASLCGKAYAESPPHSPEPVDTQRFQLYAQHTTTPAAAAVQVCDYQTSDSADIGDVAVHKFPVDKQLLLQMRFRQMYGRKQADLVTTPAKMHPTQSVAAGIVSASHVGPAQFSSALPPDQSEMQPLALPTATTYGNFLTTAATPYHQQALPVTAAQVPPDVPHFEDLNHSQNTAAMQQSEMSLVQHSMADPGVHAQWPSSPEAHVPVEQAWPIPSQDLHAQHYQPQPCYAWSTQQLTAIAAAAATAAAAAFQQEASAKEAAHAVAAANPKSAEQVQVNIGALSEPAVRHGLQAATEAPPLSFAPHGQNAQDAQTMTDAAILAPSGHASEIDGTADAFVSCSNTEQGKLPAQMAKAKRQEAVPKQTAALRKLKHRSSASRGIITQALSEQDKAVSGTSPQQPAQSADAEKPPNKKQLQQQEVCQSFLQKTHLLSPWKVQYKTNALCIECTLVTFRSARCVMTHLYLCLSPATGMVHHTIKCHICCRQCFQCTCKQALQGLRRGCAALWRPCHLLK